MFRAKVVSRHRLLFVVSCAVLLSAGTSRAAAAPLMPAATLAPPAGAVTALRPFGYEPPASAARPECFIAADPVQPRRWLRFHVGRWLSLYGSITCNETMGAIETQTCGQRMVRGVWQWVRNSCVPRITRITKYGSATTQFKGYWGRTYRTYTMAVAHPLGAPELVYRALGDPYRCCRDVAGPHGVRLSTR